jgi:carbamoyltransferase
LGAALALWHIELKKNRKTNEEDQMQGSFLGPKYSLEAIEKELKKIGAKYSILDDHEIIEKTVNSLTNGEAIGWFQGRMEFGPRALGGRSIIGDPRSTTMQKNLNLKVKYRESFRPFAPSVLKEDVNNWFDIKEDSPYMLLVSKILNEKKIPMNENEKKLFGIQKLNIKRSDIPAVTHVDYTARVQTVHKNTNPKYYNLIKKFKEITNCSVLLNTSFNVRGEPIVNTPKDAFRCFMNTELDKLVIENCFLDKKDQDHSIKKDYKKEYELD